MGEQELVRNALGPQRLDPLPATRVVGPDAAGDYRVFYAVTFTLAKDGGSARKSGGTKINKLDRPSRHGIGGGGRRGGADNRVALHNTRG